MENFNENKKQNQYKSQMDDLFWTESHFGNAPLFSITSLLFYFGDWVHFSKEDEST